jgi:hypothetical protein
MDFNFGKFSSREGFGGYQPNDNQSSPLTLTKQIRARIPTLTLT